MDRSKQRGDGTGDRPGAVSITDGDASAADSAWANHRETDHYINRYAEESQASTVGRKSYPVERRQSDQSGPVARCDTDHDVTTGKQITTTDPHQKADASVEPAVARLSPVDDCTKQMEPAVIPRLMTAKEVAAYLRVSVSKVWRLPKRDPDFPRSIPFGGSTRWERLEVDRYVDNVKARRHSGR